MKAKQFIYITFAVIGIHICWKGRPTSNTYFPLAHHAAFGVHLGLIRIFTKLRI